MYTICDYCCRVKGEQYSLHIRVGQLHHPYYFKYVKVLMHVLNSCSQLCHCFLKSIRNQKLFIETNMKDWACSDLMLG